MADENARLMATKRGTRQTTAKSAQTTNKSSKTTGAKQPLKESNTAKEKSKATASKKPTQKATHPLECARQSLLTINFEGKLPCRDAQYEQAMEKISKALQCTGSGGTIYISGVPGTGKTATIMQVHRALKRTLNYAFIAINGMTLTAPSQAYVEIHRGIVANDLLPSKRRSVSPELALRILDEFFAADREVPILMLADEIDLLCNQRQDVLYKIFDWAADARARLTVVAIANTLDMPERMLTQRVTSRLGLSRISFNPYTHDQITTILEKRMADSGGAIEEKAVQLIARKVAAVTGDLRKAISALEASIQLAMSKNMDTLDIRTVQEHFQQLAQTTLGKVIATSSPYERLCLMAVIRATRTRGGDDCSCTVSDVALEMITMGADIPDDVPTVQTHERMYATLCRLAGAHLIDIDRAPTVDSERRVILRHPVTDLDTLLNATKK